MLSFTLGTVSTEVAETHTLVLRGGSEFPIDRRDYSPEGLAKLLTYAEGRYLRDGARSVTDYPIDAEDIPAWRAWCKGVGEGFTLKTPKGEDPSVEVKATPFGKWFETATPTDELPDGTTVADFGEAINAAYNELAEAHANERVQALYTGKIPEGKAGGTQPELSKLKAAVSRALMKYKGVKRTKIPKLPGSVGELRVYWLTLDGIPVPDEYDGMGEWFDAIHAAAKALVEKEREDMKALMV